MTSKKAKYLWIIGALLLCGAFSVWAAETLVICIEVAPKTLNLQNQGQVVTVHTDIGYSLVDTSEVRLNDVLIDSWKADNQGNFVAKFLIEEIKALDLAIDDYNTLTLSGYTVYGEYFCGSADVYVVNKLPSK